MTDKFEITDEDTGEVFEIPMDGIVGGLRDMLIDKRRRAIAATTWSRLSEQEQKDEIIAASEFARGVVYKLAEAIAEGGRQCAHVSVAKFGVDVDKGELTVACKGYAQDEVLLDLVHSKGKVVKLTVVDPEQFNRRAKPVKADPDQPSMFGDGDGPDETSDDAPEQDDDDIAEEMDAELDRMEEPDDLHKSGDEVPPENQGYSAGINGAGPDENPYDGGSDEYERFKEGYESARADVQSIRIEAIEAAHKGAERKAKGWRKGTDAERVWLAAYDEAISEKDDPTTTA